MPPRGLEEGDTCPICMDDLYESAKPQSSDAGARPSAGSFLTTHCKRGCGNHVHVKCMILYAEHALSDGRKGKVCTSGC